MSCASNRRFAHRQAIPKNVQPINYRRQAKKVADPMTKTHRSCPSPLYEGMVEDLEIEVEVEVALLIPVAAVPVPVAEPAEETCTLDNFGSAINSPERPVTFLQDEGTVVAVPETKLTAAHYRRVSVLNEAHYFLGIPGRGFHQAHPEQHQ
jgi:hypothetical protein